ncbi:hypothetical protein [Rathayibacter rathayi]|uniref:hypothetical protein n=1 Tax=Rathayibacter rathayi TaxID=33887 RepID=UPI0011B02D74|nr:hypothetical protein [Rathayibacter rathayi]
MSPDDSAGTPPEFSASAGAPSSAELSRVLSLWARRRSRQSPPPPPLSTASPVSGLPVPGLPEEKSRTTSVKTKNRGVLYDILTVLINGDLARVFIPQTVKPRQAAAVPVIWFIHSAQANHTSLSTVFAYAYLSGEFRIAASYLWAMSAGGALACENYGAGVFPGITGVYLVNGVYDLRDTHDRTARGRLSIGGAFGGSTAQVDAHSPKRLPASAWAGTNIRVVVSDTAHPDTSVLPALHGRALLEKATSTVKEASVRTHGLGHNPPSWANQDGIDAIFRWHSALCSTPALPAVVRPSPAGRGDCE